MTRYPGLPHVERELSRTQRLLDGFRKDGRWPALSHLDRTQRERIDAVFGDLVERLASVATLCEARRTV